MRFIKTSGTAAVLLLAAAAFAYAQAPEIPKHGRAVVLFGGKDLSQFDTFLPSTGLNSDPNQVFKVENRVIHISGREMGYIITRQEYKNYYLRAEFKWAKARRATAASSTIFRARTRFGRVLSNFKSTKAAPATFG